MFDESLSKTICLWGVNYLLLSTIFISVVWCLCKSRYLTSDSLRDQLWKLALIAPIVFTFVHAVWQPSSLTWNLAERFKSEQIARIEVVEPSDVPVLQTVPELPFWTEVETRQAEPRAEEPVEPQPLLNRFPPSEEPVQQTEFEPFLADSAEDLFEPSSGSEVPIPFEEPILPVEPDDVEEDANLATNLSIQAANAPVPLPTAQIQIDANIHSSQLTVIPDQQQKYWSTVATLLGFVIFFGALRVMLQSFLVYRKVSRFKIVEAGLAKDILSDLQRRLDCPFQIELLQSSTKIEPAACGIWRKKILVPANLTEHLSADEIEALLAHEVAHLLRRDPVWAWSLQLIRSCLCWQPLNFLAVRKWRMSAELCCDSDAVAAGVDRLNLARCLTHIASWKLTASTIIAVGASTTTLGIRVERLVAAPLVLDRWSHGFRRSIRWGLLLVLLPLLLRFAPSMSWDVQAAVLNDPVEQFNATPANDSNQEIKVAQPLPVEDELPFAEPLSIPPLTAEPLEGALAVEIHALTTDLTFALELLSDQEDDPEILAAIAAIQAKLERLNARASEIDTSSTFNNSASIQE